MELLQGETLRQRVAAAPLPWRKAVEIGVEIAEGLAAAHAKGIVHRDLKPENLFITEGGHVKILDFGLAQIAEAPVAPALSSVPTEEHTTPGTVLGTAGYMSPEQARGGTAGPPSDIFSLGCVLHEMLTGKRTFARGSAAESLAAILKEDPPPPSASDPSIPPALDALVRHCLEKAQAERFQSTRDLAFALRAVLTGSGPAAQPPEDRSGSAPDLVPRATTARRPPVGRRELVALGVVVLMGAGLWLWRPWARTGSPPGSAETASIAVLPFQNLGGADADEYHHLWAERYDRGLRDVFAVEDDIARSVAQAIRPRLAPAGPPAPPRPPPDFEVYDLYLRGRAAWSRRTPEEIRRAIDLFQEAIRRDPILDVQLALGDLDAAVAWSETPRAPPTAVPRQERSKLSAIRILMNA